MAQWWHQEENDCSTPYFHEIQKEFVVSTLCCDETQKCIDLLTSDKRKTCHLFAHAKAKVLSCIVSTGIHVYIGRHKRRSSVEVDFQSPKRLKPNNKKRRKLVDTRSPESSSKRRINQFDSRNLLWRAAWLQWLMRCGRTLTAAGTVVFKTSTKFEYWLCRFGREMAARLGRHSFADSNPSTDN